MKPRRRGRPAATRCLICSSKCVQSQVGTGSVGKWGEVEDAKWGGGGTGQFPRFPGSSNCSLLEGQLQQIFILRELLQVSADWCAQLLQDGGGDEIGNPDSWFKICDPCMTDRVWRAWGIHQRLMALQLEMNLIRGEIKEKMRVTAMLAVGKGFGATKLIRKLIFPELEIEDGGQPEMVKVEADVNYLLDSEGDDVLMQDDPPFSPDADLPVDADDDHDPPFSPDFAVEDFYKNDQDDDEDDDDDDDEYVIPARRPPGKSGREPGRPFGSVTKNRGVSKQKSGRGPGRPFGSVTKNRGPKEKSGRGPGRPFGSVTKNRGMTKQKSGRGPGRPFGSVTKNRSSQSQLELNRIRRKYKRRPPAEKGSAHPPHSTVDGKPRIYKKHPKIDKSEDPDLYVTIHGELRKKSFHWNKCNDCQSKFKDAEEFKAHVNLHEARKNSEPGELDCHLCTFPANDSVELANHMRNRHERTYQALKRTYNCTKCAYKCHMWKLLKQHVDQEHPGLTDEELMEVGVILKCPAGCTKEFKSYPSLVRHKQTEHPELVGLKEERQQCDQCHVIVNSKLALKQHIFSKHKRANKFVCETCGKGFSYLRLLEEHKKGHDKSKKDFVCHICGCDYVHKSVLDLHYKNIHPEVLDSTGEKGTSAPEKIHTCRYCSMTFPFSSVLKRHIETHKEQMGHRCEQCGKYYVSSTGLKRHLRLNHPTEKIEVPCPHCFKTFPSVDYMKDHLRLYCKMKNFTTAPVSTSSSSSDSGSSASMTSTSATATKPETITVDSCPQSQYPYPTTTSSSAVDPSSASEAIPELYMKMEDPAPQTYFNFTK